MTGHSAKSGKFFYSVCGTVMRQSKYLCDNKPVPKFYLWYNLVGPVGIEPTTNRL